MDVEIDRATKALDQRDHAGLGLSFFESCFFEKVPRDSAGDDI